MRHPLLLVLLLALPLRAVVYLPPNDAESLFQRDELPLDTDTMRELSGHLTDLARRDLGEEPVQWRANAQLLAIAVRLNPANRAARDLDRRLANGEVRPPPDGIDLGLALLETWSIIEWLLQPEAGREGQLLGQQLLDALRVIDPRHPLVMRHDPEGEADRWRGVVAELARFQAPLPPPQATPAPASAPAPSPPGPPEAPPSPIQLRRSSLSTPLYFYDQDSRMRLGLVTIAMDVLEADDPGPFTFSLRPEFQSPLLDTTRERVRHSLERSWPDLPPRELAILDTAGWRYASRNGTAISGPASLLMHAALAGRPLRDDVVFVGDLGDDGSLTRPHWSWDYLWALRGAKGGRLIVPPELQPELRAMLALENPQFFTKWEVLIASSLDAALQVGAAQDGPDSLANASGLFAELQTLAADKPLGPLCVNEHVRRRLEEVLAHAPFHSSAAMLLLQGQLERPTRVERVVAARILHRAVEPLAPLVDAPLASLGPERIEAAFNASRARLTPFTGSFRTEDDALAKEALELTTLAHALRQAILAGTRDNQGNPVSPAGVSLPALQQELRDRFTAFLAQLAPDTGDPPPEPAPQHASPPQNPP